MPRPRTIPDERIVAAAREVFLERGFGATSADLARRAGVSEGTLFARYPSKDELFEAALGLRGCGAWRADLAARVGQGEVRANLGRALAEALGEAARVVPTLMAVFARGHDPGHNPLLARLEDPVRGDIAALAGYLRAEAALGRVRVPDPETAAQALLGALGGHVQRTLLRAPGAGPPPKDAAPHDSDFVASLLELYWHGLAPQPTPSRGAS